MENNQQDYISNPFKVIFTGIGELFKYNQNLAIAILAISLIGGFGNTPGINGFNATITQSIDTNLNLALTLIAISLLVIIPLTIFFTTMMSGVSAYTALMTSRQKTVTIKEAFTVTLSKFWILLGIDIIVFFKVLGGTLLFIVPGIRAAARYSLVHMFVFDQNTGVSESIARSKNLAKDHLIEIFGIITASILIPIVGSLMQIGGQAVAYAQLVKLKSAPHEKPKTHWLNYFVVILPLILIFLIMSLLVTIAAVAVG